MSEQDNAWPAPKFSVQVQWNSVTITFQELAGLDSANTDIVWKNVTFKHGNFSSKNDYWDTLNKSQRGTMVVTLVDEAGNATMSWTLSNAVIRKVTGVNRQADGNGVTIESMIVSQGGQSIDNS